MFTITLYNNSSDNKTVHKNLTLVVTLEGTLRHETECLQSPVITVKADNKPECNYAYIPLFGRYYFINSIRAVRNGIFELTLISDVLMSFNLDNVTGILQATESNYKNHYLPSEGFVINSKQKTDIMQFPNGLNSSGEYILITAGGLIS